MGSGSKARYKKAVLQSFLRRALPVDPGDTRYGWIHQESEFIREHFAECGFNFDACSIPTDARWDEFIGTDVDFVLTYGLEVDAYCQCGLLEEIKFRRSGSLGELLKIVLEADDE